MPPSEYDPLFGASDPAESSDLTVVRRAFEEAARPFLSSPWVWFAWGLLLPSAALTTEAAFGRWGASGVLLVWSAAILLGGLTEIAGVRRRARIAAGPGVARWALRAQGNLSLVGVALSALLLSLDLPFALAGLWLLLLGHSFYILGGLASRPMRSAGILFQVGGAAALWPGAPALAIFAATTAAGCLWLAVGLAREVRR